MSLPRKTLGRWKNSCYLLFLTLWIVVPLLGGIHPLPGGVEPALAAPPSTNQPHYPPYSNDGKGTLKGLGILHNDQASGIVPPWSTPLPMTVISGYGPAAGSALHKNKCLNQCLEQSDRIGTQDAYSLDFALIQEGQEQPFSVTPAMAGNIIYAGKLSEQEGFGSYGNTVIIGHGCTGKDSTTGSFLCRYHTFYAHLADGLPIVHSDLRSLGPAVTTSTEIGTASNSGLADSEIHLHFALYTRMQVMVGGFGKVLKFGFGVVPEPFTTCVRVKPGSNTETSCAILQQNDLLYKRRPAACPNINRVRLQLTQNNPPDGGLSVATLTATPANPALGFGGFGPLTFSVMFSYGTSPTVSLTYHMLPDNLLMPNQYSALIYYTNTVDVKVISIARGCGSVNLLFEGQIEEPPNSGQNLGQGSGAGSTVGLQMGGSALPTASGATFSAHLASGGVDPALVAYSPLGFNGLVGDPIQTFNGNFFELTRDLFVAGPGRSSLAIDRVYNSLEAVWPVATTMGYGEDGQPFVAAGPPHYFGTGWTFPFETYVLTIDASPLYQGAQVKYADGRVANFTLENGSYVPTTPGVFDQLSRDGDGFVLLHKDTLEIERFNSNGNLVAKEDLNGNRITLSYAGDLLVSAENSAGRRISFEHDGAGHIVAIRAPEGKVLRYGYSGDLLTSFTDAAGHTWRYAYDHNKLLTSITTPKGHPAVRQAYDDQHRVAWQIAGAAQRIDLSYEQGLTTVSDSLGRTRRFYYNPLGQLTQISDALNSSEHYAYDQNYNRIYRKDKLGREWSFLYDQRANRTGEQGPLGWSQRWSYNELDLVTSRLDPLGRQTRFSYDGRGNLTAISDALGKSSTSQYDARGLPVGQADFNGNLTRNVFAPQSGDLIQSTNGAGDTRRYSFDGLGRLSAATNGRGYTLRYGYDGNDQLVAVDGPLGYRLGYRYDANRNRISAADPNGGVSEYRYDQSEHMVEERDQLGFSSSYEFDVQGNLVRMRDAEGRLWAYDYDALDRRVAEHGPEDTHILTSYDLGDRVIAQTRCNSPLLAGVCPTGQSTSFAYNELDYRVRMLENAVEGAPASADTNVATSYQRDLLGNLLARTDANGQPWTYRYDALSRLVEQRDPLGGLTVYHYDAMGNLLRRINPRGYATSYRYDGANRRSEIGDALGQRWSYSYDGNGNLSRASDPLGIKTELVYDELDRLSALVRNAVPGASATSERNVTTRYAHDLAGNLTAIEDPRGGYQTRHSYDAAHRQIRTVDAGGGITLLRYDRVDNLIARTDPNGHTTSWAYDGLNRQRSETNPEGHSRSHSYDRLGNLLREVDARGYATSFAYDGMRRQVLKLDALGGQWRSGYDALGNLLREVDANGNATSYSYDALSRRLRSTDAEGYVTSMAYDPNGNLLTLTDGNGNATTYRYDELDQLASSTNAEGETTQRSYDPLGNLLRQIAPDGIETHRGYDPLYRLSALLENARPGQPGSADVNVETRYSYDQASNLLAIVDAEQHTTRFHYDPMSRLAGEVDAAGFRWSYAYDPAGNRILRVDGNGQRTSYDYYPDNQLRRILYADGSTVRLSYDPNNNRIGLDDALGQTRWAFDPLNRVSEQVDPFSRRLASSYDPVSNRTGLTYPDGQVVASTYYRNNWLKSVEAPQGERTSYLRDGVGLPLGILNPNSTSATLRYDRANRPVSVVNRQEGGANAVLSGFAYRYDQAGMIVAVEAEYGWRNPSSVSSAYRYDGLRRLVRASENSGRWSAYRYDRVGNRLQLETNDASTTSRPSDPQRLTYRYNERNDLLSITGNTHPSGAPGKPKTIRFRYDGNGNRVHQSVPGPQGPQLIGRDYHYDGENRLVMIVDYQGGGRGGRVERAISQLLYDGDGRRLAQLSDAQEGGGGAKRSEYAFDGTAAIAEYTLWNAQHENFYRGDQGRLLMLHHFPSGTPGQISWYHYDGMGSVSALTKQLGQATHNYRYEPYGQIELPPGNFTDPHNHYTLGSAEWQEQSGLFAFGARQYDPLAGVWLSKDQNRGTLAQPATLHRSQFALNNPLALDWPTCGSELPCREPARWWLAPAEQSTLDKLQ